MRGGCPRPRVGGITPSPTAAGDGAAALTPTRAGHSSMDGSFLPEPVSPCFRSPPEPEGPRGEGKVSQRHPRQRGAARPGDAGSGGATGPRCSGCATPGPPRRQQLRAGPVALPSCRPAPAQRAGRVRGDPALPPPGLPLPRTWASAGSSPVRPARAARALHGSGEGDAGAGGTMCQWYTRSPQAAWVAARGWVRGHGGDPHAPRTRSRGGRGSAGAEPRAGPRLWAEPAPVSTGRWRLVKPHLESRLSDSVGRAWLPPVPEPRSHCLLSWRYLIGIRVAPLVLLRTGFAGKGAASHRKHLYEPAQGH